MKRKDFNSTREYIEHLIYKENALSIKNIALGLLIIGSIALISLQFKGNSRDNGIEGLHFSIEEMKKELVQAGYSLEEINRLSKEEISSAYTEIFLNNKGQIAGTNNYTEYPEQESSMLKADYYLKASKGEFNSIVSDFEDKKLSYRFSTSYNKELITISNDAYYLRTIMNNNSINSFKVTEILSNIKDAQMLLYGVLLTEEKYRRDTIVDSFSLSPILLNKKVTVTSKFSTSMASVSSLDKDKKDSRFNEMTKYLNDGDYIFYRFDFTIDNNDLSAYIYKNMSTFELSFYGMYNKNPDNMYLTVYDYIQMESNFSQDSSNIVQTPSSESITENTTENENDSFTGNNENEMTNESTDNPDTSLNNDTNNEDIPFDEEMHLD